MTLSVQDSPKFLYKYYSPERVNVLLTCAVKLTPLGDFNDPFEGRPNIQGLSSQQEILGLFEKHLVPELLSGYSNLPHSAKVLISKEQYMELMIPAMRENFPVLREMLDKISGPLVENLSLQLNKVMGAFCLSEVCDSPLMWAHYCASHRGFLVEFNARHAYFHASRSENDELRHIRRVLYRDARPNGPLSRFEGEEIFLVKSTHWSYEREWRMFLPLAQATNVIDSPQGKAYLFQIPPDAITGVILGARASAELRSMVQQAIRSSHDLRHVKIRSCYPDPAEFVLRVRDGVT
jgi:hypothetical protein